MQTLRHKLDRVAAANVPVLIEGESGTGKDIIAQLIHLKSPWASGKFVKVNCPAIPDAAIEGVFFELEKVLTAGAAAEFNEGYDQTGTLFLDEVSELNLCLQSKLLQLLQDDQFYRFEAEKLRKVRVICGTTRRLDDAVACGRFRRDLFYRINVAHVRVPALRERAADIPGLVDYFLQMFNKSSTAESRALSAPIMDLLIAYSWPGNIRELKNLIERYVIFGSEEAICSELHKTTPRQSQPEAPVAGQISLKKLTKNAVREFERQVIFQVLKANDWNRKRAARALSISYRALLYKLKDAGVTPRTSGEKMAAVAGLTVGAELAQLRQQN